jgi:hypothetical protein
MNLKKTAIALAVSAATMPAMALSPSVGDPGFNGDINLGVASGKVESNFLAETFGVDLSDDTINALGQPDDKNVSLPVAGFDLGWTFSGGNSRIFAATDTKGHRLDYSPGTQIGFRYDTASAGNFQLVGILTTGTNVYEDPYQLNLSRGESEVTSNGGRFTWDKIFTSNFELDLEARTIDVDKERSGESAVGNGSGTIATTFRKLLERDGDYYNAEIGYVFNVDGGHTFRPAIGYVNYDLDGDAMTRDGAVLGLTYGYDTDSFGLVVDAEYGKLDGDKANPFSVIAGQNDKNDTDRYSLSADMTFPGLFGLEKWTPHAGAFYAKDDSDIDFNDTTAYGISVGMSRAF